MAYAARKQGKTCGAMVFSLNFLVTFSFKRKSDKQSSREKVTSNLSREKVTSRSQFNDANSVKVIKKEGWKIITIWECNLKPAKVKRTLLEFIKSLKTGLLPIW